MKHGLFITGIVVVILLVAVWIYLLFFGTPTKDELFGALNFGGGGEQEFVEVFEEAEEDPFTIAALRQLSLKRIIGYTEIQETTSSSTLVLFVEAGTGHLYTLDIVSGEEKKVSNTTIPTAKRAVISSDGSLAAIVSEAGNLTVLTLNASGTSAESYESSEEVEDFSITKDNQVLFSTKTNTSLFGRVLDPIAQTNRTIFEVPFREARVIWGNSATDTHFVYPKTSSQLEGYLYEFKNGVMKRLPAAGYGFSANSNGVHTLYNKRVAATNDESYLYEHATSKSFPLTTAIIPEKCGFSAPGELMICGASTDTLNQNSIDDWYKGALSHSDGLFKLDLRTQEESYVIDLNAESGRKIDVINTQVYGGESRIYFQNKTDQTLWIYEQERNVAE